MNSVLDPIVFLQVHITYLLMKRYKLTVEEFLKLDVKKDILNLLRLGYEQFHLTGDEGILKELDDIIKTDDI